jgi:hypothetical protein
VTIRFEFLGQCRVNAGRDELELEVEHEYISIRDVLRELEKQFYGIHFPILEDARLVNGLLLFRKGRSGESRRISDLQEQVHESETFVLATGMEGG